MFTGEGRLVRLFLSFTCPFTPHWVLHAPSVDHLFSTPRLALQKRVFEGANWHLPTVSILAVAVLNQQLVDLVVLVGFASNDTDRFRVSLLQVHFVVIVARRWLVISLVVAYNRWVQQIYCMGAVVSIKYSHIVDPVVLLGAWSPFLGWSCGRCEARKTLISECVANGIVFFVIGVCVRVSGYTLRIGMVFPLHVVLGSAWPSKGLVSEVEVKSTRVM